MNAGGGRAAPPYGRAGEAGEQPRACRGCLSAAGTLTDATDTATMIELHTGRLEALYSLGRLDEGDEVYRELDRLCTERWSGLPALSSR